MKNVHLISRWIIKDGHQSDAEEALISFENMAKEEEGTLLYMIHRPMWNIDLVSNPTPKQLEVLFFEVYKDQKAFEFHVIRQKAFMEREGINEYFETPKDDPMQTSEMVEFLEYERGFIKNNFQDQ